MQPGPPPQVSTTAFISNVVLKDQTYDATGNDYVILVDATLGAVTITLPSDPALVGLVLIIKKIDAGANAVTVDGDGLLIDGAATVSLPSQWDSIMVQSFGTAWYVIA